MTSALSEQRPETARLYGLGAQNIVSGQPGVIRTHILSLPRRGLTKFSHRLLYLNMGPRPAPGNVVDCSLVDIVFSSKVHLTLPGNQPQFYLRDYLIGQF